MTQILKKSVNVYRQHSPESYQLWVDSWEKKKLAGAHIPGYTTVEKAACYPFPFFVPTGRAFHCHRDTNDVPIMGTTLSFGLLPHGCCCRAGLLVPGACALLLQNVGHQVIVDFTSAHAYTLNDKKEDQKLTMCCGPTPTTQGDAPRCASYGVGTSPQVTTTIARTFAIVLSGHEVDLKASKFDGRGDVVPPNTNEIMSETEWDAYFETVALLLAEVREQILGEEVMLSREEQQYVAWLFIQMIPGHFFDKHSTFSSWSDMVTEAQLFGISKEMLRQERDRIQREDQELDQ